MDSSTLLEHYRRERRGTRLLIAAVPEELFDWTPHEGGFSLGGLVRHLMQAEIFWRKLLEAAIEGRDHDPFGLAGEPAARLVTFRPVNVDASNDERLGATFADCLEAWGPIQTKTEAFLESLSEEQIAGTRVRHPLVGLEGPLGQMVLVMVSHEGHHRGQLSAYLKNRGVEHPATLWVPDDR